MSVRAAQIDAEMGSSVPAPASSSGHAGSVADTLEQRLAVEFTYPVHFTRGLLLPHNLVLRRVVTRAEPDRRHRCLVIVDDGVAVAWPTLQTDLLRYADVHAEAIELVCPPRVLLGGERAKNQPDLQERVLAWIHEHRMDRQCFVICIGGGALLDAVGYAAATAHRGVRLIRVPTTVLSQNDSGVGVKNGVNAFGKKNFVGTFAPPFAVVNDLDFIQTLERRAAISGMSEAVKVALIKDAGFFGWLEENTAALGAVDPRATEYLIRRCAQLHLDHIATSGDPFELGSARPLDFGHWAAHKLESMSQNRVGHGDAVAIGVALDSVYSARAGYLARADAARVLGLLEALGFRLWDEAMESRRGAAGEFVVLQGLGEFREHLGGELTVTLLRGIGSGFETHEIDEAVMAAALDELRRRDEA